VTYNQNFTLGTTSKTGYTFLGWTLNGDDFVAGVWEIDSDITLVAKYQANAYTITYNGLTNESHLNPLNYTIETETIHLSAPSERLGYQFNGWFTQATGGSKVESIQLGSTGNRTLYAQFSPIIYDITYLNLEGSTTSNPLNYTIETQTFTLSNPTARQHYQFVGWYTELVGGTLVTKIELGSTEDVILYARWTPITYSITYANLQSSTHSNPLTYTIETDTIILLDPTNRIGYTFAGWYTQLTLGQRVYEIDTNSADDLTLFARWTANSYTIEFDVDGGMPISDMTVTYGQSFTLPNAQKLGFTFAGWELDGNIFTSGIWNLDENIFLVAVWTEWPTIIFDLHGGVGTLVISQAPGSNISAPAVNPVKDGYTFLHYYVSDENTAYVFDVMPEEDLVLHAKWEAIIYEIKYENLFGLDSNNVDTFTIEDEDITLLDPESRTGYTFSGWFDQLIGG